MKPGTLGRREALALMAALPAVACGNKTPAPAAPSGPTLKLDPLVDLVPAPGLVWVADARPKELLAMPGVAEAVELVVPSSRFDRFAERNGGVDLRRVEALVIASYAATTLALARTPLQTGRIEAAFAARAVTVEGRAVEGGVTRLWGSVGPDREQVALFGADAVGLEHGHLGPLQPAVYFAQGKLRRARPALHAEPLAAAAELVGPAPLRFFAPGPFEGEWSGGLGGLLRATTAVAATAHPVEQPGRHALEVQLALAGAWGADAPAAAERLAAALQLLSNDTLGRLLGLDHPLEEPRVSGDAQALRLQIVLDPITLARGLHAATDARIDEIMKY
jgi:hypothetical protein